jgi:hypothetical protein
MDTKLTFILIPLFAAACLSCHKLCVPRHFNFMGGVASVLPDNDSVSIGDTLWIKASLPINYKFWQSGTDSGVYNLRGAKYVETDLHLSSLNGLQNATGAIDSFSFVGSTNGSYESNPLAPHFAKTIKYSQEEDKYVFSVGIIPRKRGIYCLTIIDIYQAMKKCDKISVSIVMTNKERHLHYFSEIYYGGGVIDAIDLTHSYCFKVF